MSDSLQVSSVSSSEHGAATAAPNAGGAGSVDPREIGLWKAAYNVREAVEATGLSRTSLYKALKSGRLVAFKNGKIRLFLGRDLAAFVLEMYRATRSQPKP